MCVCARRGFTHEFGLPGTSTVSLSFKTPKLHFGALREVCSSSSDDSRLERLSAFAPPTKGRRESKDRLSFSCEVMMRGSSRQDAEGSSGSPLFKRLSKRNKIRPRGKAP